MDLHQQNEFRTQFVLGNQPLISLSEIEIDLGWIGNRNLHQSVSCEVLT